MKFNKPALTVPQHLQKWESRGLLLPAPDRAAHFLKFIGYYRLSAYALPFQQLTLPDKPFHTGTSLENILRLYVFDRELRLIVMDAIERIEVAFRICLINEMCVRHGPHWFMDAKHFYPRFKHHEFLDKIDRELQIPKRGFRPAKVHQEVFINHFYSKYTDPYICDQTGHCPKALGIFEIQRSLLRHVSGHVAYVANHSTAIPLAPAAGRLVRPV